MKQYRAKASKGCPYAMFQLSVCYLYGWGVRPSLALSRMWAGRCEGALGPDSRGPMHLLAAAQPADE